MLRKTKVLRTARQKRPSWISSRTLSAPANVGVVTRSHCRKTRTSANTIGYTANISRNAAYGPAISDPDFSSARIYNICRFASGFLQRVLHRSCRVDGGFFIGLRQQIENLNDVRIEVQIACALDVVRILGESRPSRER